MKALGIDSLFGKEFVGTDQLRKTLTAILKKSGRTKEFIITQHGKPQAVLLDFQTYLALTAREPTTIGTTSKQERNSVGAVPGVRGGTLISFIRKEVDPA